MIAGQPVVWGNLRMVVADTNRHGDVTAIRGTDDTDADAVAFTGDEADVFEVECAWFAGCDHTATSLEPHPVLGDVPICERCKARNDRMRS